MDNHPIPQDVTGFQFRLIGNMTVKQFAYVAIGCVTAVLLYYIPLFILLKIILIPLFILGGVVAAFVPIEGRPVEVMVTQFLKAIFAPTQFLYQKTGGHLMLSTIHVEPKVVSQAAAGQTNGAPATPSQTKKEQERQQQLETYLASLHQKQSDTSDADRLTALFGPASPTPAPTQQQTADETVPTPTQDTTTRIQEDTAKLAQDNSLIAQMNAALTQAKAEEQAAGTQGAAGLTAHAKVVDLEKKLQDILLAKQQLEQELAALKTVPASTPTVITPPIATVPASPPPAAQAPVPPPSAPVTKGNFPSLPDVPNILLGMVKDSSGNVLPNILVEVKDAEENPVRAFKTNQLGQFMSATPLNTGSYTLTFEDAKNQYRFDPVTVVVNDQILSPLEVAAHDLREELRKSLFA